MRSDEEYGRGEKMCRRRRKTRHGETAIGGPRAASISSQRSRDGIGRFALPRRGARAIAVFTHDP